MWKGIVSWQVSANPYVVECGLGPASPLGSSTPAHGCPGPYSGFSCSGNTSTFPSSTPQNDKEVGRDRDQGWSQEVAALCERRASPTSYPRLNELSGHHCVTVTPSNRALIIRLFIQNVPRLLQEPPNRSSTFSFQHILHTLPEWSIKKKKKHVSLPCCKLFGDTACGSLGRMAQWALPTPPAWASHWVLGALRLTPSRGSLNGPASSGLGGLDTVSFF